MQKERPTETKRQGNKKKKKIKDRKKKKKKNKKNLKDIKIGDSMSWTSLSISAKIGTDISNWALKENQLLFLLFFFPFHSLLFPLFLSFSFFDF